MPLPHGQRGADALFKKLLVNFHPFLRQDAHVDFGS
jgi:hypothetical protein